MSASPKTNLTVEKPSLEQGESTITAAEGMQSITEIGGEEQLEVLAMALHERT